MKIAIYSPYLDTAGGGEKYMLTIAETLSDKEQVDFLLGTHLYDKNIPEIKKRIEKLHGLDLSKVNFMKAPIGAGSSLAKRLIFLKKYDFLFALTDGSIFLSTARNSILHFQVPFENKTAKGVWGKKKLVSWKMAIYNSNFTKDIIEKSWPIKGKVVYPPVSIDLFKPLKKKNQIISVGRFFGFLKDKKQQVLIETFKKMVDDGLTSWSLHLVGGAGEGDNDYIDDLKKRAKGLPIYFYPNMPFEDLVKLYGESTIYWHASGFGEIDPTKMEHFGITTVEAMASGVVPIVFNGGGQREIVESKSGFLWNNLEELIELTKKVINDQKLASAISKEAIKRSKIFNKERFCRDIQKLVYG